MRFYVVKVGDSEEFDIAEVPEKSGDSFTFQVHVDAKSDEKQGTPAWKVWVVGFLCFCALVVVPPVAYGMSTGDFSFLKAISGYFTDLMAAVVKAAISALDKK